MEQKRTGVRRTALAALAVLVLACPSWVGGSVGAAFAEGAFVGPVGYFSAASDGSYAVASTDVEVLVESDLAVAVTPQSVCGLPDDVATSVLEASVTGAAGAASVRWTRTVEGRDGAERDDAAFSAFGESHRLADDTLQRGETYRYRAIVEDGAGAQAASAAVTVSQDYRIFHDGGALADDASGASVEGLLYDDGREHAVLSVRSVDAGEASGDLAGVYGALARKAAELGGSIGRAWEVSLLLPPNAPAGVPAHVGSVHVGLPAGDAAAVFPRAAAFSLAQAFSSGSGVRVVRWDAAAGAAVEVPGGAQLTPDGTRAVFSAEELGMFAIVQEAPAPGSAHGVSVSVGAGGAILYQGKEAGGSVEVPHASDACFQVVAQAGFVIDELLIDGTAVGAAEGFSIWEARLTSVVDDDRSIAATFRSVKPAPDEEFTLTTSAGAHGSVDPDTGPEGVRVKAGSVQTVRFLPEAGYRVSAVTVEQDGASAAIPALGDAYTFTAVADVRVHVEFEETGGGPVLVHEISASAGAHGSVSPTSATVQHGGEASFSFFPDDGYRVANVLVDGVEVKASTSYAFRSVVDDHELEVLFEPDGSAGGAASAGYVVRASAGPGGRVSPDGVVNVAEGSSATFAFIPDEGYAVSSVVVDGCDAGSAPRAWTFEDVRADHTVQVSFMPMRALGLAPTGDNVVPLALAGTALAAAAAVLAAPQRRRCPLHAADRGKGRRRGAR